MTTTAKPPKPLRMSRKVELIPVAQYAEWHERAIQAAGLTKNELAVLSAVAEYYRLLDQRGCASSPTIEKMAQSAQVRSIDINERHQASGRARPRRRRAGQRPVGE